MTLCFQQRSGAVSVLARLLLNVLELFILLGGSPVGLFPKLGVQVVRCKCVKMHLTIVCSSRVPCPPELTYVLYRRLAHPFTFYRVGTDKQEPVGFFPLRVSAVAAHACLLRDTSRAALEGSGSVRYPESLPSLRGEHPFLHHAP